MKKQWSKGAHVAPYNAVGPSWFNEIQILSFAYDMVHFICLMVQDFIDYGFAWFPKIHHSDEIVSSS